MTVVEKCEECGGPMVWTSVSGYIWTACRDGNHDQLELLGLPSLDVKKGEEFDEQHWNLKREGG